jgi:hypothetical protein
MKKTFILLFFVFSYLLSFGQNWMWGRQCTGTNVKTAECYGQATDSNGNIYITGEFVDTLFFGTQKLASDGYGDMYIAKFDKNGNALWVAQGKKTRAYWGDMAVGNWLTLDDSGNVIVTGQFIGIMVFGNDTVKVPTGDYAAFTVKYNSSGSILWAVHGQDKTYNDRSYGQSVCTDKNGNIYTAGVFSDSVTFGPYQLVSKGTDIFIVKCNPQGHILWAKQSNVPSAAIPQFLRMMCATDPAGHLFLAGTYEDTLTFGNDTLIVPRFTNEQAYLLKFDTNGSILWAQSSKTHNFNSWVDAYGMIVDAAGNPIISGGYYGDTARFGTKKIFRPTYFLAKYNNNGQCIWAEAMPDTNFIYGCSIATDNRNNIYATGAKWSYTAYASSVQFILGGDTVSSNRVSEPAFIYMLDSNGMGLCGSIMANSRPYLGNTVSRNGNYIYCAGSADTSVVNSIFGSDTLNNSGIIYPFVARWQSCNPIVESANEFKTNKISSIIFPNPNNGKFTLEVMNEDVIATGIRTKSVVEIYNMLGEKVYSKSLNPQTGGQGYNTIDLIGQPAGIYLYRVLTETGNLASVGKFVIQ